MRKKDDAITYARMVVRVIVALVVALCVLTSAVVAIVCGVAYGLGTLCGFIVVWICGPVGVAHGHQATCRRCGERR